MPTGWKPITAADAARLVVMRHDGASWREIGLTLGRTHQECAAAVRPCWPSRGST